MMSASFLTTRCLSQSPMANQYPEACKRIQKAIYVDYLLTGGNNVEEITNIQREISKILASGGFM